MKKSFKKPTMIGGLEKSGKTSFLLALNQLAGKRKVKPVFFKPFDTGLLGKNSKEEKTDGELFAEAVNGKLSVNLASPYMANESYPVEIAFKRDGIKINWGYIHKCLALLDKHYDKTFVEPPSSLMTPLTEQKLLHQWIEEEADRLIWLIDPAPKNFHQNLTEINLLKQLKVKSHILINNASRVGDTNFIFYFWQKIEKLSGHEIEGMLPYIHRKGNELYSRLASKIETNIPDTLKLLIQNS